MILPLPGQRHSIMTGAPEAEEGQVRRGQDGILRRHVDASAASRLGEDLGEHIADELGDRLLSVRFGVLVQARRELAVKLGKLDAAGKAALSVSSVGRATNVEKAPGSNSARSSGPGGGRRGAETRRM